MTESMLIQAASASVGRSGVRRPDPPADLGPPEVVLVCGSPLDQATAPTSTYHGVTYRLGCPACKARFDSEPDRLLAESAGGCCHQGGDHRHDCH